MSVEVSCDNCGRLFYKQKNKVLNSRNDYCCLACSYEHRKYDRVEWKSTAYRKLVFFAETRQRLQRNGGMMR